MYTDAQRQYHKEYYQKNKKKHQEYMQTYHSRPDVKARRKELGQSYYKDKHSKLWERRHQRFEENKAYIRQAKDVPCMDCGNQFPYYVMDFDHVRGVKFKDVSQMVHFHSLERIKEEVSKCDVVCSNCHRIRTHTREANNV